MQEKSCKPTKKNLGTGGMKVAVNIRMPEGMKKILDKIATQEFRSLNSVILQFLDEHLKGKGINWQEETQKKPKK
jgi:hypothetical protein